MFRYCIHNNYTYRYQLPANIILHGSITGTNYFEYTCNIFEGLKKALTIIDSSPLSSTLKLKSTQSSNYEYGKIFGSCYFFKNWNFKESSDCYRILFSLKSLSTSSKSLLLSPYILEPSTKTPKVNYSFDFLAYFFICKIAVYELSWSPFTRENIQNADSPTSRRAALIYKAKLLRFTVLDGRSAIDLIFMPISVFLRSSFRIHSDSIISCYLYTHLIWYNFT